MKCMIMFIQLISSIENSSAIATCIAETIWKMNGLEMVEDMCLLSKVFITNGAEVAGL